MEIGTHESISGSSRSNPMSVPPPPILSNPMNVPPPQISRNIVPDMKGFKIVAGSGGTRSVVEKPVFLTKDGNAFLPGPLGRYWLKQINQVDTSAFAVNDKYSNPVFVDGNFKRNGTVYMAFNSSQQAKQALEAVKRHESGTVVQPTDEIDEFIVKRANSELENRRQMFQGQNSNNPLFQQNSSAVVVGALMVRNLPDNFNKMELLRILVAVGAKDFVRDGIEMDVG